MNDETDVSGGVPADPEPSQVPEPVQEPVETDDDQVVEGDDIPPTPEESFGITESEELGDDLEVDDSGAHPDGVPIESVEADPDDQKGEGV